MSFITAFQELLKTEGHTYTDDPVDHGGPTRFGITQGTLSNFLGHQATEDEVRNIDMTTVQQIYKKEYWDRMMLNGVRDDRLASLLFDQGVNRGTRPVVEEIQRLVGTQSDGVMGPITLLAINQRDPRRLTFEFVKVAQLAYASIVKANPSQVKYMSGWLNRTHKFLEVS